MKTWKIEIFLTEILVNFFLNLIMTFVLLKPLRIVIINWIQ